MRQRFRNSIIICTSPKLYIPNITIHVAIIFLQIQRSEILKKKKKNNQREREREREVLLVSSQKKLKVLEKNQTFHYFSLIFLNIIYPCQKVPIIITKLDETGIRELRSKERETERERNCNKTAKARMKLYL